MTCHAAHIIVSTTKSTGTKSNLASFLPQIAFAEPLLICRKISVTLNFCRSYSRFSTIGDIAINRYLERIIIIVSRKKKEKKYVYVHDNNDDLEYVQIFNNDVWNVKANFSRAEGKLINSTYARCKEHQINYCR